MSIYFNMNGIQNKNNIKDCVCSLDGNSVKRVKSIWGVKDSSPVKLWERRDAPHDPYAVAPEKEYIHWDYTLNETDGTITLNYFKPAATTINVTVYDSYRINGKTYRTRISGSNTQRYMFESCSNIETITFGNHIELECDLLNTASLGRMFSNCRKLTDINFGNGFNTEKVVSMSQMFYYCNSLANIDLSTFNTSNVTNMYELFEYCNSLTNINFGENFTTRNVLTMHAMFRGCTSLTNIDLSCFDTGNVTNMAYLFDLCSSLEELDLSGFDTGNVVDMQFMFDGCSSLPNLELGNFNTEKVTNMWAMFANCKELTSLDLRNFDTRNVTSMRGMFDKSSKLKTIYVSSGLWSTAKADILYMFRNCGTSAVTYA